MLAPFKALWADESGQDLVEYALLVALIAIIVIAALRMLGPIIATIFNDIGTELETRLTGIGRAVRSVDRPADLTRANVRTGDHPWISARSDWS